MLSAGTEVPAPLRTWLESEVGSTQNYCEERDHDSIYIAITAAGRQASGRGTHRASVPAVLPDRREGVGSRLGSGAAASEPRGVDRRADLPNARREWRCDLGRDAAGPVNLERPVSSRRAESLRGPGVSAMHSGDR